MKINYKIELLTDWHVGSGLDSGADADTLVLKDENNLPYIPGKTVKGLLRDSLNEIKEVKKLTESEIDVLFGEEAEKYDLERKKIYFSNVELSETEKLEIITNKLSSHLYKNIASTKIEKKTGVAAQNSLRTMEVCIPLSLVGSIETEIENAKDIFETAFKWTRNLGVNRNRGLGRCKFSINEKS